MTCDLGIVENAELREVMRKGTKFRIADNQPNAGEMERICRTALDDYTNMLSARHKIPIATFNRYKIAVMAEIKHRLRKSDNCTTRSNLSTAAIRALRKLQATYIITCADKAAGNYVFTCKKYYFQAICKELGVELHGQAVNVTGNAVYKHTNISEEDVAKEHLNMNSCNYAKKYFTAVVPLFFATPKMHKTPYKFRYIAGAQQSSEKPLSLLLQKVLAFTRGHMRNYCAAIKRRTGRNLFWSIRSTREATRMLQDQSRLTHVLSADFTTMFTTLPHSEIFNSLDGMLQLCYNNSRKRYLCVGFKNVYFCDTPGKSGINLTLDDAKNLVRQVINNTCKIRRYHLSTSTWSVCRI